jgi:hypothetical protein
MVYKRSMVAFTPEHYEDLAWIQTGAISRFHELKSGGVVLARMEFKNLFGALAEGQTTDGVWTFRRKGLIRQTVFVRPAGSKEDVIRYEPNWSKRKGIINGPGEAVYNWEAANFWCTDWTLSRYPGAKIAHFKSKGVVRTASGVALSPEAKDEPNLPLLLMLGCFIAVLHRRDTALAASRG